jgi:putative tryptophan/tyrosine transport system substrate-binding protein
VKKATVRLILCAVMLFAVAVMAEAQQQRKIPRIGYLGLSTLPTNTYRADAFRQGLRQLGYAEGKDFIIEIRSADGKVDRLNELAAELVRLKVDAIAELALKNRLPVMYSGREHMDVGGLMYYGPSFTDLSRRAATYVDKILKGAKPADLPIEQPTKFELVINLKTAKQIGLTITPNVLARADRVIR